MEPTTTRTSMCAHPRLEIMTSYGTTARWLRPAIFLGAIAAATVAGAGPAHAQTADKDAKPAAGVSVGAEASAEVNVGGAAADANAGAAVDDPLDDPLLQNDDPGAKKPGDPLKEQDRANAEAAQADLKKGSRYQDIVVVPRKDFLKGGRLELAPFTGITVNDPLIRHYAFGGDLTFFLTDVFGVGLQGMYFIKERTDREGLVGLQYDRTASINKYIWSAALNFSYVPVYGKFALFNKHIVHWEAYASGGIGMTQTEIIPRIPSDKTFKTNAITPNFGGGGRLYITDWLTVNVSLRDYLFNDKFEPTDRSSSDSIDTVKENAEQQFVHNILLYAGVGFYLPPSFSYRTAR